MNIWVSSIVLILVSASGHASVTEAAWLALSRDGLNVAPAGDYPFHRCFRRAAIAHHVPEALLVAVARGESNFDPAAVSAANAIGVMQIQWPGTARHLGFRTERQLFDACRNIAAGARYLRELYERFDGNWHRVLAAYNYGPSRIGSGTIPDGAAWYSAYILRHFRQLAPGTERLPVVAVRGAKDATGAGSFAILVFEHPWQLENLLRWLEPQLVEHHLEWRRRRDGQHEIRLAYDNAAQRRAAEQALRNILGFNPNSQQSRQEAAP